MSSDLDQNLGWMGRGWDYFGGVVATMSAEQLTGPSSLPGWTGRHILAHVAFNARALGRLAHWARTGEETPMYASAAQRGAEIESGAHLDVEALRAANVKEQSDFDQALSELTGPAWGSTVTTAQGRPVPATVLPWLRARELWIHAIDLQHGNGFSELPADFLDALITDVLTRRKNVHGELLCIHATDRREHPDSPPNLEASTPVMGRTADLARWLTGRGTAGVRTRDESPLPLLAPWL